MKILKCISIIFITFLCCSCVKYENNVTVSSNKSVNFEINLGYSIDGDKRLDIEKIKDTARKLGFFVDSYHDSKYTGYRLSKKYKNINEISKNSNEQINLANILNGNFDEKNLYKVKKGFFKNIYAANYTYDFRNLYNYKIKIYLFKSNNVESLEAEKYINDLIKNYNIFEIIDTNIMDSQENFDFLKKVLNDNSKNYEKTPVIIIGDNIIQGYDDQIKNNISIYINSLLNNPNNYNDLINKDFNANYDLSYNVNLPTKAISNNATTVLNNGKNLIWKLDYFSPVKIEYSFEIVNKSSIIIVLLIAVISTLTAITSILFYKRYKLKKDKDINNNTNISNIIPNFDNEENTIISIDNLMKK